MGTCPVLTPNICFGGCFDLKTSLRHCGKCGNRCQPEERCINGVCTNGKEEEPSQESGDAGENEQEFVPEDSSEDSPEKVCQLTNNGKERCDGQDNDCNGKIDDVLPRGCYSGPQGTSGVGPCKKGQQRCLGGSWGKCEGESLPKAEDCNGQDNDCDGKIDNISERSCYSGKSSEVGKGPCRKGLQSCQSGKWGPCKGETLPQTEICNNIDDNCDGQIDEQLTKKCFTGPNSSLPGLGICKSGVSTCLGGKWGSCTGEVTPQKEICDGKDNDCNGIEDSFTRPCYGGPPGTTGKGLCKNGSQTCASGKWGPCTGQKLPQIEACNNKDDNCNGQIDEQLTKNCFTGPGVAGKGVCKQGSSLCKAGKWETCTGQVTATTEKCDRIDNDCDGEVDEKCTCVSGTKRSCGNHTTKPCRQGTQSCNTKGQWGACLGQILPSNEICDNKDNDCDGLVDEALTKPCYDGPNGTLGKGRCKAGVTTCNKGSWSVCQGQTTPFTAELCNGVDDDCDGQIDESPPNPPKCSKYLGVCQGIKKKCVKGTWEDCDLSDYQQHSNKYQTKESNCDGKDNDCDGKIDQFVLSCYEGFFSKPGVGICKAGTRTCTNGSFGVCVGQILPKTESCNKQDDNCNGKVDEGCVVTLIGSIKGYKDGSVKDALLNQPYTIAFDQQGILYIGDSGNKIIRKLDANKQVSTVAGIPEKAGYKDGQAKTALFRSISDMLFDGKGELFIADADNELIRKLSKNGQVSTIAGMPGQSGHRDGPVKTSLFASPVGVIYNTKGELYIVDTLNHVIRKLSTNGQVSTVAGTPGKTGHKNGPAKTALFHFPSGMTFDPKGNLYIVDHFNHVIRKLDTKGQVSTISGTPKNPGHKNGPAKTALFRFPTDITIDNKGNLFIADKENHIIRKLDINGQVSTFAGVPGNSGHKNGPLTKALFSSPTKVLFYKGSLYIVDTGNHLIKKIVLP